MLCALNCNFSCSCWLCWFRTFASLLPGISVKFLRVCFFSFSLYILCCVHVHWSIGQSDALLAATWYIPLGKSSVFCDIYVIGSAAMAWLFLFSCLVCSLLGRHNCKTSPCAVIFFFLPKCIVFAAMQLASLNKVWYRTMKCCEVVALEAPLSNEEWRLPPPLFYVLFSLSSFSCVSMGYSEVECWTILLYKCLLSKVAGQIGRYECRDPCTSYKKAWAEIIWEGCFYKLKLGRSVPICD